MSLINDALKRAKQAQQKSPPPPATGVPLRPVEPVRPIQSSLGILLLLALVVLVGVGGFIIWFTLRVDGARPSPTAVAQDKPASAPPATLPKPTPRTPPTKVAIAPDRPLPSIARPASAPVTNPTPVSAPAPASTQPASAQPITAPTSTAATGVVTEPVVMASAPPPLLTLPKLQGVFYRPERPAALLNGKMVLIGGTVGEYRVVAMSQQSVTVVRAGQTNVLNMPD